MSRAVLVVPIVFFLYGSSPVDKWVAVALIVLSSLTDLFDGMLARYRNEVTEVGKIIDPIADKLSVVAVLLTLGFQGRIPLWFLWMAIARDGLIIAGGIYLRRRAGVVLQSNTTGKWAVVIIALFALIVIIDLPVFSTAASVFFGMSVAMVVVSFLLYAKRFVDTISM